MGLIDNGSEFKVNTDTDGADYNQSLAKLVNGDVVSIWSSPGSAIRGQLLGPTGSHVGSQFVVSANPDATYAGVSALSTGGFVVVYQAPTYNNNSPVGVHFAFQKFDENGTTIGSEVTLAQNGQGSGGLQPLGVAGLSGGGFVVSYLDNVYQSLNGSPVFVGTQIRIEQFDNNSNLVQTSFVGYQQNGGAYYPHIAALTGGGYAVAWSNFSGGNYLIETQAFDGSGSPLALMTSVAKQGTGDGLETGFTHSIAALSGGGFVTVWGDGNGFGKVMGQVHLSDGGVAGNPFVVSAHAGPDLSVGAMNPAVTALSNDRFLVTWEQTASTSGYDIHAQAFDAAGNAISDEAVINTVTDGYQILPEVTTLANGSVMITWNDQNNSWGPNGQNIVGQVVDVTAVPAASTGIHGVFTAYTGPFGQNGWLELWRTDGSGSAPEKLSSFVTTNNNMPDPLTVFNGLIYFLGQDGRLWKTDGTPDGTKYVPGISGVNGLAVAGGSLYLMTTSNAASKLFAFDGTTATEIAGINPAQIVAGGDALFVRGSVPPLLDPEGNVIDPFPFGFDQLFKVDASGAHLVPPFQFGGWTMLAAGSTTNVVETGGALYFISIGPDNNPAVYRATETGVDQFALNFYNPSDMSGGSYITPQHLYVGNGTVYVQGSQNPSTGNVLFVLNAGGVGTQVNGAAGSPLFLNGPISVVDGVLYFAAHDVTVEDQFGMLVQHPSTTELYKLDGSSVGMVTGGTTGIGDFTEGTASHGHYYFTAMNNSVLELFRVDANGATSIVTLGQSWGTLGEILEADGKVFITDAVGSQGGSHVWVATASGSPVLLIGADQGVGLISNLTYENGKLVFSAYDNAHGQELWTSDGTPEGTVRGTDLSPGLDATASLSIDHSAGANGNFYFTTHDALGNESLWSTNAAGNTQQIVLPSDFKLQDYTQPIAVGDAVYFFAFKALEGNGFFKADQSGVSMLGSYTTGLKFIDNPVAVGSALYFTALGASNSTELFRSDAAGITEITRAANQPDPSTYQMIETGGATFFLAGQHLYKLSGNIASEVMNGAREIANPGNLTNDEGALYFTGDDGSGSGVQVFRADVSGVSQVTSVSGGIVTNEIAVASGTLYYVNTTD